ncbi:MAG: hypothetical protein M3229_00780, partial [Actinomycetota bacterium]|nr:hypothetical protein [Actinomycetota bacterium]
MTADATRTPVSLFAALVAALVLPALAAASPPATPPLASPGEGTVVEAMPSFAWSPVAGAERYEFHIAADAGFNAPVWSGATGEDRFLTRNTRAAVKRPVPNGTYYWRVRAISAKGEVSAWSPPRSFRKLWSAVPALQSPSNGGTVTYPGTPLTLRWSIVPHAARYLVTVGTDASLASVVATVNTRAESHTPQKLLAPGMYYWNVIPLDARGNRGSASQTASFTVAWPTTTTTTVTDLASAPEVFDAQLAWNPIPGAVRYEVEVNSADDFAAGSKVCCGGTSIGTTLSPTVVLKDNTYYWRMRALDGDGNAGIWNLGPAYTKTFDKVPPVTAPSVKNLRMRDHLADPGTDVTPGAAGYQTRVPILAWDAVPGAASYQVDVAPFSVSCDWSSPARWSVLTSTTWWTPLASVWNNVKPYPDTATMLAYDPAKVLATQPYCARVRARSDRDGSNGDVYGDYTYLEDGETGASFTFAGYDSGSACTPSCNPGYLGAGDYLQPISGTVNRTTPLFTWRPLSGIQSYFVIVAKDASFSNIVDYALTRIPAYAPRSMMKPTTYSDETTLYYWAVLPASGVDGSGAAGNPLLAARESFQKNSTPPSLLAPASGTDVLAQPTLQWTPATGARRYRLQVAQDPSFSTLVDDVVTTSTAYTAQATYPADTLLYWRVRADDENLIGLNWSAVGTFRKRLLAPAPDPANPAAGALIPTWRWSPVQGAASYDLLAHYPNGREELVSGLRASAITATQLTGQGIWTLRVRANFPKGSA